MVSLRLEVAVIFLLSRLGGRSSFLSDILALSRPVAWGNGSFTLS